MTHPGIFDPTDPQELSDWFAECHKRQCWAEDNLPSSRWTNDRHDGSQYRLPCGPVQVLTWRA